MDRAGDKKQKQVPSASSGQALRLRAARFAQDDVREGFGETFLLNDRVNQLLLEHLDAKAWRAKPVGSVRTIAAIFAHMHNVRRKWLRLSKGKGEREKGKVKADRSFASSFELPPELDRARCTQKQVAKALKESAQLCAEMLADKRVTQFVRDGWAKPWGLVGSTSLRAGSQADPLRGKTKTPGAAAMLAYMVSHEAHHRGQVCMLAHQMGYRLPMKVMSKMWAWERD
jgi:uncharacterized damage-inducible protein DinB